MKKRLTLMVLLALVTCLLAIPARAATITVGSKAFTESELVSELYADALSRAGFHVVRKQDLSSAVIYRATQTGQVDLYPEYTGTIVLAYLKKDASGKPAAAVARLAARGVKKLGLVTLTPAPADDRQGIAVRTVVAKRYHLKTISDLQRQASHLRFVSQGEFDKRSDGLPGMERVYGKFRFKRVTDYADGLKYRVLASGAGDVAPVSTTDGQLTSKQFTLLKDDRHLWPAYNLVPLANRKVIEQHPKVARVLNQVDAKLTTATLIRLNRQVTVEGKNYRQVARAWVKKHLKGGDLR